MSEDSIQLPELNDIQMMLTAAKEDIKAEVEEDPELASSTDILVQLINIIEEKIKGKTDLEKLDSKQKIDLAAHLSFLQSLLEDLFYFDEDFDEEFDEEGLEIEHDDTEKNN